MHNLSEYIEMRSADVATDVGADLINAVFTEKLGVVIGEKQLEEFFSQVSWGLVSFFPFYLVIREPVLPYQTGKPWGIVIGSTTITPDPLELVSLLLANNIEWLMDVWTRVQAASLHQSVNLFSKKPVSEEKVHLEDGNLWKTCAPIDVFL